MTRGVGALTFCAAVFAASTASAQIFIGAAAAPRRGSVEVGGGAVWHGGFDVDILPANLSGNGNDAPPFVLFEATGRVQSVTGVQGRVGFYLSPSVSVEGGVQFSRPVLGYDIAADAEDAESLTVEERIDRYVFDGSILYHMRHLSFAGGRGVPFLLAGAGYLRELHDGQELVETGASYHAGAGIKVWFGQGRRRTGLRLEGGAAIRDGGYNGGSDRRTVPTAAASLMYLF